MGQEVPHKATPQWGATAAAPSGMRLIQDVYTGYQTYKAAHDDLQLWVPLLFWFNKDVRLAFPSVSVPYGQRFITFSITQAANIYRCILNPSSTTTNLTNPTLSTPQIATFDLHINNMFVLPEVHDIFIDRVAFTLVRVHRRQTQNLNKSSDLIHLVQLKWPIETLCFGFQPTVNRSKNTTVVAQGVQTSVHSEQQLTIREFIDQRNDNIDALYVDKFWQSISDDKWIYVGDEMLSWMGYEESTEESKPKWRYLHLLKSSHVKENEDYKYLTSSEFKNSI